MKTYFEWDIETYETDVPEDDAEILDHHHAGALKDYRDTDLAKVLVPGSGARLVLVRDERGPHDQHHTRSWAYVINGGLPTFFREADDSVQAKVPARFQDELTKRLGQLRKD